MHTSPWCTFASPIGNLLANKGTDLTYVCAEGFAVLKFNRSVHETWSSRCFHKGVEVSSSHEQAAGCSTARAVRVLGSKGADGIRDGFPWAISTRSPRLTVRACTVGGGTRTSPWSKRLTFEVAGAAMAKVLARFTWCTCGVAPSDHLPVIALKLTTSDDKRRARRSIGARASEAYPNRFGALLAASASCRS